MASQPTDLPQIAYSECGSGPPLLLVHGAMITGEMFDSVSADFAKRHRVIMPDLRGHGRSRDIPGPYDVKTLAGDLTRLLDRLGVASTAVLGYSHGGAIAQQLALNDPGRCARLILACTYAFNRATTREWLEGRLAPLLIRVLGMRRFARLVISLGLKRVERRRARQVVDLIAGQDAKKMREVWEGAMSFDSRARLYEIHCPTLVLAGAEDNAVPIHHARMLQTGIKNSRLVVIDGADHALIWTHPGELARATEAFLAI